MAWYAVLTRESSNRVFGLSAPRLAAAEVVVIGAHLSVEVNNVEVVELGGLSYVRFSADELTANDIFILSNLALGRGLFRETEDAALEPVDLSPLEWYESDLITIQRYVGKTNEQFTHLLVNVTLAESVSAHRRASAGKSVSLLDPVAGRGSALNRGLMYGFDVGGIELDERNVEQYRAFLSKYLQDHRVKHSVDTERIRKGEHRGSSALNVVIRPADPTTVQRVRMARASTDTGAGLFPGKRYDVVVGDLPYGIAHTAKGGAGDRKGGAGDRSPERLVVDSLPGWRTLMADGAALGLSWNTRTLRRETLANVLVDGGFDVVQFPCDFEHEVDRQITRDLIICR